MNIYDALNEYKQYLLIEKKVSDNTLKNYMRDLEHFINYIQKQNQVVLIILWRLLIYQKTLKDFHRF